MTRTAPAPGFGLPARAGFGMSSVGESGSVGTGETRSASWVQLRRTRLSVV